MPTLASWLFEAPFFVAAAEGAGVWESIRDVLVLLGVAMLLGIIAERLRQSAVVGYLAAGTLVGPGALGWVGNEEQIVQIAELGVALLLFTIGLEFSPRQLLQLGRVPWIGGALQIVLTMAAGTAAGALLGLGMREAIVIGAMTALSSTACVLRVLRDRAEIDSQYGRATLGILLMQDAAVVPLVLIVTALAGGGTLGAIAGKMAVSILLAVLLVGAFYVLFNRLIPKVLILPTWRRNRDLPVLLTVCIAGGTAWAAHSLGLSPALGAFVAGVLLAVSPFSTQIQADIQPLRVVLVTLFFAAIGMFGDLGWLVDHVGLVLAVLAAIVIGKGLLIAVLTRAVGLPLQFAVPAGLSLAQIGEFSFVLATIARGDLEGAPVLSETTFQAMVSATILSLLVTPYLIAAGPPLGARVDRTFRLFKRRMSRSRADRTPREPVETATYAIETESTAGAAATDTALPLSPEAAAKAQATHERPTRIPDAILIVGFGPAGQRVAEGLLDGYRDRLVVIDMNYRNVEVAQRYGLEAHIGDATQTDVLLHAGLQKACLVALTVPNPQAVRRLIHHVRHLRPDVLIIVRSRYHIYRWELLHAGAHIVIDEEDHVGARLAEEIQQSLRDLPAAGEEPARMSSSKASESARG